MDENKNIDSKRESALKSILEGLTDEQREKARSRKTVDELKAFAAKEGIELPDELLDAATGGYFLTEDDLKGKEVYPPKHPCPRCESKKVKNYDPGGWLQIRVKCLDCGYWGESAANGYTAWTPVHW